MESNPNQPPSSRSISQQASLSEDESSSVESLNLEDAKLEAYAVSMTADNFWNYFESAIQLKNDGAFEEAMLILRALLIKGAEIFQSELSVQLAMVYFQLGNALLERLEANPDLFSSRGVQPMPDQPDEPPKEQNPKENGAFGADQDQDDQDDQAGPLHQVFNDEEVEEIQVAWENLDACRVVLEQYLQSQQNLKQEDRKTFLNRLANCRVRLGDCENWKEDFASALIEYRHALALLESLGPLSNARRIAELHFLIGNTLLYEFKDESLAQALKSYKDGRDIIAQLLGQVSQNAGGKAAEDVQAQAEELAAIVKTFEEKIDEVVEELETKDEAQAERRQLLAVINRSAGFAKSQFEDGTVEVKKLGKFGGGNAAPKIPQIPANGRISFGEEKVLKRVQIFSENGKNEDSGNFSAEPKGSGSGDGDQKETAVQSGKEGDSNNETENGRSDEKIGSK